MKLAKRILSNSTRLGIMHSLVLYRIYSISSYLDSLSSSPTPT